MGTSTPLFEALFKAGITEEKQEYLQQVATEHPYFAPAQFYLLQQMKPQDAGYKLQISKTSLLFNNPHWLFFQLQETTGALTGAEGFLYTDNGTISADPGKESVPAGKTQDQKIESVDDEETVEIQVENIDDDAVVNDVETIPNATQQPQELAGKPNDEQENLPGDAREVNSSPDETPTEDAANNSSPDIEEVSANENSTELLQVVDPEVMEPASQEVPRPAGKEIIENVVKVPAEQQLPEEEEVSDPDSKEIEPMNIRLNLKPSAPAGEVIAFEPLHTTDYFASQGIKLSAEIPSGDKLGRQLRSFTEWLKTMKKVHTDQLADTGNQTDVTIQKLAERSNAEDEVVTEAMADVLVQQGKAGKAAELYKKLSLLNPSKYAYFAAKIDQLKEQ